MHVMLDFVWNTRGSREGHENQPEHIERGQPRGDPGDAPQCPMPVWMDERLEQDFVLAYEPGQGRDAGNGQCGGEERPRSDGDLAPQAAHLAHVLLARQRMNYA